MRQIQKSVLNKIEFPAIFSGSWGAGPIRLGTTACAGGVFLRRRYSAHPVNFFLDLGNGETNIKRRNSQSKHTDVTIPSHNLKNI